VGHGIVTPGREDSWGDVDILDFGDTKGQRVLDIGASDGFFSFFHEVGGAAEVVALDNFKSTPFEGDDTGIVIASNLRDSRVNLSNKSLYDLDQSVDGLYDRVLFLNVLYHLEHPLYGLQKLAEVCIPGGEIYRKSYVIDYRWKGLQWLNKPKTPICRFFPKKELNNDPSNWFGPNVACVACMAQSCRFCRY